MEARAYAARNRQGHDWFGHSSEPNVPSTQPQPQPHPPSSSSSGSVFTPRTQMIKPVCNSNQWFKHGSNEAGTNNGEKEENKIENPPLQQQQQQQQQKEEEQQIQKQQQQQQQRQEIGQGDCQDGQLKQQQQQQNNNIDQKKEEKIEENNNDNNIKSEQKQKDSEIYCQRDKSGSDWFSHNQSQGGASSVQNTRVNTVEGNNNANKMRNESENWFSHDPNAPSEPLHAHKGRLHGAKQSSDMYNVFHHNQN